MLLSVVSLLSLGALGYCYTQDALNDQIVNLPGAENLQVNFNQFSGYLTVAGSKHMHYWMVESMSNPSTDPVAFWTNGGPGCSGLLGFLTEQGPFRANKDMSLKMNPFAWNQRTNMVFIEAPCGVGFSYSDNEDDYKTDDAQTAKDNFELIQQFMKRFPEYSSNDMYISSESYGGHYMPTLAKEIVDRNSAGADPHLNFKGFAVGNPATTFYSAIPASLDTYWGHQLVSKPLWDSYTQECKEARIPNITLCETYFLAMYREVGANLNPYALDYPVCKEDSPRRYGRNQRNWFMRNALSGMSPEMHAAVGLEPDSSYEPCADDYMTAYLNQDKVKQAIHVKQDIEWADCSRTIRYKQTDGMKSMVPIYQYLVDGGFGLKILVFSGDDDGVCATIGTQSWIWDMGYTVAGRAWQPYVVSQQTAGFLTKWSNTKLAFLTVHGAGHEVPAYKPEVALHLWNDYLDGKFNNA